MRFGFFFVPPKKRFAGNGLPVGGFFCIINGFSGNARGKSIRESLQAQDCAMRHQNRKDAAGRQAGSWC